MYLIAKLNVKVKKTKFSLSANKLYEVLERTQHGDSDVTAWFEWFLTCLERALIGNGEVLKLGQHGRENPVKRYRFYGAISTVPVSDRRSTNSHTPGAVQRSVYVQTTFCRSASGSL